MMKTEFPFPKLFGANISEFKAIGNLFELKNDRGLSYRTHLYRGLLVKYAEGCF